MKTTMQGRLTVNGGAITLQRVILVFAIVSCVSPLVGYAAALPDGSVSIYQTNFSVNPMWTTNNPNRYYWDAGRQMYHYHVEGGTGGYAFVPVGYDNGPVTLEYDVLPVRTDKDTAFRFGLGTRDMDISKGTIMLSEFSNRQYGRLMDLRVITGNNNLLEITSLSQSYCDDRPDCATKHFEENRTYHVVLRFDADLTIADMKVYDKTGPNETFLWGSHVTVGRDLAGMTRLFISSIGDYGSFGSYAEGYIDNVELYHPIEVTRTPPTRKTVLPTTTVSPANPTTPQVPAPTTKSGGDTTIFLGSLGLTVTALFMWKKSGK